MKPAPRNVMLMIRFSRAELAMIRRASKNQRGGMSAWAREVILPIAKKRQPMTVVRVIVDDSIDGGSKK